MKKSNFTEEQIAFALKQAEPGTPGKEIVRQLAITEAWGRPSSAGCGSSRKRIGG